MGEKRGFFDLKSQFIFYASYHNQPVNVLIHLFCIWQLVWSGLALMQYTPALKSVAELLSTSHPLLQYAQVNLALLITLIYVVTYLLMDPIAGGVGAVLMIGLYLATGQLVNTVDNISGYPTFQAILGYHVIMWIAQFVGHGVFEKRAPALLDSWDQAFITAPLFVLLEILFFFGYKKKFHQECMVEVLLNKSFTSGSGCTAEYMFYIC